MNIFTAIWYRLYIYSM